jgi:predicted RNA-binding protein
MKVIYWRVKKTGEIVDEKTIAKMATEIAIPIGLTLASSTTALAAGPDIKQAMKPLITALQDLAEPVSYAFMIYGGIKYMSGHSSEGQQTIKNAIGGYVLIQWIPWIFEIIKSIGR